MDNLVIRESPALPLEELETEIVERKGLGHPDTLCDAVAENLSRTLSRYYLDHFGLILHHNVDKVLLAGGASRPRFGGGEILEPIDLYLAGRATQEFKGERIPVEKLAVEATRQWFAENLKFLDPLKHLRIHCLIRSGSRDLSELFLRGEVSGPLSNDTSIGVGFAPMTALEQTVLEVEREINSPASKERSPEYGTDIKVMGTRLRDRAGLTLSCAFVDRFVADRNDYNEKKRRLIEMIRHSVQGRLPLEADIQVNTADGLDEKSLYLTVTGTSAESGDDGEVGRGNRANGLITPYRPMTMEASAGKNPMTHTGKLYQVAAQRIAERLAFLDWVDRAECYLVSQIGKPIQEPLVVDLKLNYGGRLKKPEKTGMIEAVVRGELDRLPVLWKEFLDGNVGIY